MLVSCLGRFGAAGKIGWLALAALGWLACSGEAIVEKDGSGGAASTSASSGSTASTSASSGQGGSTGSCDYRILPMQCDDPPPDCPDGQFPASDASCWTGVCLDCLDGCQRNHDCTVVRACGCSYHEGCSWAATLWRAAQLDQCIVSGSEQCTVYCPESFCNGSNCPWCDADDAQCVDGACEAIINHMCE